MPQSPAGQCQRLVGKRYWRLSSQRPSSPDELDNGVKCKSLQLDLLAHLVHDGVEAHGVTIRMLLAMPNAPGAPRRMSGQ